MIQTNAKLVTNEDHGRGYVVCGCGKFAHVFRAAVLKQLPKGYDGELCQECSCWMVSVEKLTPNVQANPPPAVGRSG